MICIGCAKPVANGNACFESSECQSGSECVQTVYGNYCMRVCSIDVVRCEDGESCLQTAALDPDGATDAGVDAGAEVDAGAGADADAGVEPLWVCMPGDLEDPGFVPRDIGQICEYSLDCIVGGVCVCIPGATCEPGSEGRNGPTCQRLCDVSIINQCPQVLDTQPQCTDLGDGRGFCDPTTLSLPTSVN